MATYQTDYHQWALETADRLRRGEFAAIDVTALADEVEDLSRRQRAALESRMVVLVTHLLKWDIQCVRRSRSWQLTIETQRRRVERLLHESPSLRPWLEASLPDVYREALNRAVCMTGLSPTMFPDACPYTVTEILSQKRVEFS
jgi:hypothetical protein